MGFALGLHGFPVPCESAIGRKRVDSRDRREPPEEWPYRRDRRGNDPKVFLEPAYDLSASQVRSSWVGSSQDVYMAKMTLTKFASIV